MAQVFTVETASKADLAEIDALFARSYPALLKGSYPPSLMVTAIPMISRAKPELVATGTYFVVRDGDEIVGAGGWTPGHPASGEVETGRGNIRHVVTDHRRVRQGIGQRLMTHVFDTASEAGIRQMACLSTLMAVPFYEACGFSVVKPVKLQLSSAVEFPAVLMRRDL